MRDPMLIFAAVNFAAIILTGLAWHTYVLFFENKNKKK